MSRLLPLHACKVIQTDVIDVHNIYYNYKELYFDYKTDHELEGRQSTCPLCIKCKHVIPVTGWENNAHSLTEIQNTIYVPSL